MTQQNAATRVNGVDVEKQAETVEALRETPSLAQFRFRAKNEWIDGSHNRSTIRNFYGAGKEDETRGEPFVFDADEPAVLLGQDKGANPVEFVLHGLGACMTTSIISHAAARGIEIEELESRIEGDIDLRGFLGISEDVHKGYENIRVVFRAKGDVTEEQLQELAKFSPVFDTLTRPIPVTVRFETE